MNIANANAVAFDLLDFSFGSHSLARKDQPADVEREFCMSQHHSIFSVLHKSDKYFVLGLATCNLWCEFQATIR